jgi:hypothetical protein
MNAPHVTHSSFEPAFVAELYDDEWLVQRGMNCSAE